MHSISLRVKNPKWILNTQKLPINKCNFERQKPRYCLLNKTCHPRKLTFPSAVNDCVIYAPSLMCRKSKISEHIENRSGFQWVVFDRSKRWQYSPGQGV